MPVLIYTIQPGFRLVTGGDLNQMIEAINAAFAEAGPTQADFNGLLAALRAAGVLSA
ncbi:hypothetical protein ACFFP0_24600 [Rhizobium puerariae]|uniref:PqqD family protein n=1 Tax=Rhizobium puerariae TaxID=1585791 RepID=A0ABV6AQA2_9HYPH